MSRKEDYLDVVYPIACGIDVHQEFGVAVVCDASRPGEKPKFYKRKFQLYRSEIEETAEWIHSLGCRHVCMESTGIYWTPVYNVFEKYMEEVRIINAKFNKPPKGKKDDMRDATHLCNSYRHGLTRASYIPKADIRDLRALCRFRKKLTQQVTQYKNRLTNTLTRANYKLDIAFSSVFTLSAQRIITLLLSGKPYTDDDIMACVDRRCQASREEILKACDGFPLSIAQQQQIITCRQMISRLENQIQDIGLAIEEICEPYVEHLALLMSIPGVSVLSAQNLLAEIGDDLSCFGSSSSFAKWGGCAPGTNISAGKKSSVHVDKSGKYLKPILNQAAWAAVRSKHPYYRLKFEALKSRIGTKRAIMAIMRKMLVAIWHMFETGSTWHPTDMDEEGRPVEQTVEKSKAKIKAAVSVLVQFAQSEEELTAQLLDLVQKAFKKRE